MGGALFSNKTIKLKLGLVARASSKASLLLPSVLFPVVFGIGRVSVGRGPDVRVGDGRGEVVELKVFFCLHLQILSLKQTKKYNLLPKYSKIL